MKILNLTLSVLSLVIIGCGSGSSKNDDEFGWVKNEDFKPKKEVPFDIQQDFYEDGIAASDSLGKETVAKLPADAVEKIEDHKDYITRGIGLCYSGKQDQGLSELQKVYTFYKKNPSYWNQIGTCFLLKGNKRKALLFYNKARGLNKKFAPPYNNLGVIYQKSSLDQKALVAYNEAANLNSFALTPKFNLSQLYLKYGFVNRAKLGFNSLFKSNGSDPDVVNAIAFILMSEGNYPDAKRLFERLPGDLLEKGKFGINYAITLRFMNLNDEAKDAIKNIDQKSLGQYRAYYNEARAFIGG